MRKAIILFSGGLDSTTLLYYAKSKDLKPYCLIFDYQQRHRKEIEHAVKIARRVKAFYKVVKISLPWQGSSLLDKRMSLPKRKKIDLKEIPSTYVPARNIIFLSFAASFAEAINAKTIFIGANAIDFSGYPDCRPEFFDAYQKVLKKGLKTGVKGDTIKIEAPFLRKTKKEIIRLGVKLKVPYGLTWSCYQCRKTPCGVCDSCILRAKGFFEAGVKDFY